jgi:tRNA-2-methylthio-N6-dimethylallyladenosine synthase
VRFTTSHPNDFYREIVDAIDSTPALCEHIHLPVQSGSTRVLRAMRRTYTREEYLEKISWIHNAKRHISVTTDIIVGFPGETEQDVEDTITLLDAVGYDGVFSFIYSPRPNTTAAGMPDAVPDAEKSRRLTILQERQRQIQLARNEMLIGQTFEVLVDGRHEARASRKGSQVEACLPERQGKSNLGQWTGRTSSNRIVNFTSLRENLLGEYVQACVTRAGPHSLIGEHSTSA